MSLLILTELVCLTTAGGDSMTNNGTFSPTIPQDWGSFGAWHGADATLWTPALSWS